MSRKDVFQKAFAYLLGNNEIKTKTELSERMGCTRSSVSKAYNGDPSYLTDDFLRKFSAAFPGVFSLSWLLTGEGNMLQGAEMAQEAPKNIGMDNSTTKEIERLRSENDALIKTINVMAAELSAIRGEISELRKSICVTVPVRYTTQETDPSHLNEKRELAVK